MKKEIIAIVDDEADIVELIALHIRKSNFEAKEFLTVREFYKFVEDTVPDLIILDIMLQDGDGFEVCKYLRKNEKYYNVPIIMLTAKSEETEKVLGLELGADDYITKPFSPRELVARIKAVLRRKINLREYNNSDKKEISIDDILHIDLQKYEVHVYNKSVSLTHTEFRLLVMLAQNRNWVFSREKLLDNLWGYEKAVIERTIDVHIRHLRKKLGQAGNLIKNVRGFGYKME